MDQKVFGKIIHIIVTLYTFKKINNSKTLTGWLKIKVLRYKKENPGVIQFKYNNSDEDYQSINVCRRGRPTVLQTNTNLKCE